MGAGAGAGLSAGASLVDDGVEARGHEDRVGAELGAEHGPRARPTKGDSFHTTSPAASGHGGSPVDAPAVRVSSSDHETPSKVPSSPPEVTPRPSEPFTDGWTPAHERTSSPQIGAAPPTAPRRRRATLRPRWRQHRPLDARNASTHTPQPFNPSTRPAHPGTADFTPSSHFLEISPCPPLTSTGPTRSLQVVARPRGVSGTTPQQRYRV